MTISVRQLTVLVAMFVALAIPAVAMASPEAVLRDCAEDGSLEGNYSNEDKKAARDQLTTELEEYSDCRAVISAAIDNGGKKSSGGGGSGSGGAAAGGSAATAAKARKARAAKRKRKQEATELALGDRQTDPNNAAAVNDDSDTANGLPAPVLIALIALALLCAAGAVVALSKRYDGLGAALRRVPIPRALRR